MLDLGLALFLALVAAGMGKRVLNALGELPEHPLDALALATPLGLGILALGCLVLGQYGGLNLVGLSVLLAVATELGLLAGFRLLRNLARHVPPGSVKGSTSFVDRLMLVFLVLTLGATALAAMAPVTDGDALCYHLQVPKVFLVRQAVYFDPDLHETVYPLVTELLYAIGLEFRGPVACRCLQWVLGLIFAAGVAALARPSLGRRSWWAAALAILVPAISNGMAAPLNDVSLAAFGLAAFLAWTRCYDRPSRASILLAGGFTGLALGVKYPALVLAGLLTAMTLLRPCLIRPGGHGEGRSDRCGSPRLFSERPSSLGVPGTCAPTFIPEIRSSRSSRAGSAERVSTRCWLRSSDHSQLMSGACWARSFH